jgi:hypothetical protein
MIASMQEEYNRLMAVIGARSELAVTAYLTPHFVSTDLRGRNEDVRQMLSRIDSEPKNRLAMTTVLSVRTMGEHFTVGRKTLESTELSTSGKGRFAETLTFFTDTWVDSNGTWLLERSKADRVERYVDGRLVSVQDHLTSHLSPRRPGFHVLRGSAL